MITTNDIRERERAKESSVCIQLNECDFTISTNNHNIVGFFIRRSCFVAISLLFYARDFHSFIHSTAQTMTKRPECVSPSLSVCVFIYTCEMRVRVGALLVLLDWMVVTISQQCDKDN